MTDADTGEEGLKYFPDDSQKYQTFWSRFSAGIVDGIVFLPVSLPDAYLSAPERSVPVLVIWGVFSFSSYWVYSVLLHARYGQTVGKKATNVKVLDVSETRLPTLWQAFVRDIGYIIPNVICLAWFLSQVLSGSYRSRGQIASGPMEVLSYVSLAWFLLEIVTMALNPKRRAFHDLLAGTVVICSET